VGVAVATAVIIIAVTVLLVTGYMSAFKPGENETTPSTGHTGGGRSGGVAATVTSPSPKPVPTPPGQGGIPVPEMQTASIPGPSEQPASQIPSKLYEAQLQQQQTGTSYPSPTVTPATTTHPSESTGKSPSGTTGSPEGSWFNIAPTIKATPEPTQPPSGTTPGQRQPVVGPENPLVPAIGQIPYDTGWRQIIQRLMKAIPLMFPGYYPGLQWYTVPSAL